VDKAREEPGSIRFRNPVKQQGWAQVHHVLTLDTELSDGAYRLYVLLLMYARQSDGCWPGVERLARDLGRAPSTVKARLAELVKRGLITRERRLGTSSITWIEDLEKVYGGPENRTFEQPENRTSEQPEIQPTAGRETGREQQTEKYNQHNDDDDHPSSDQSIIISLLTDFGVHLDMARRLARNCSLEFVRACIDDTRNIRHKLRNPPGFLVDQLRSGEPPPSHHTNTGAAAQDRRRTGHGGPPLTYQGNCGRRLPIECVCPVCGQYPFCRGCPAADFEESPQDDATSHETPPHDGPDATTAHKEEAGQMIKNLQNNWSADRPPKPNLRS